MMSLSKSSDHLRQLIDAPYFGNDQSVGCKGRLHSSGYFIAVSVYTLLRGKRAHWTADLAATIQVYVFFINITIVVTYRL